MQYTNVLSFDNNYLIKNESQTIKLNTVIVSKHWAIVKIEKYQNCHFF